MKLMDKVCVITGGASGIGKAAALLFASEGAKVAACDLSDEGLKELAIEGDGLAGAIDTYKLNVTDRDAVAKTIREIVDKYGQIDVLVNNAGINRDATLKNLDRQAWDDVLAVNLTGVFNCTKAVIGFMSEARRGRIINTSSVMGQAGGFGISNYAASKAGIIGFTKSVAREVASKGITVNAIAPGFIETGMLSSIPEKVRESLLKQIPAGRWGRAEEIGRLAVFLASEDAAYITGQVVGINGGYYM